MKERSHTKRGPGRMPFKRSSISAAKYRLTAAEQAAFDTYAKHDAATRARLEHWNAR